MCSGTPAPGSSSRSQPLLKQSDIAQSMDFEPSLTQMSRKYEAWLEDLQIPFETKILPSGVISRQLIFVVSPCQNIKATQLARGMMAVCSQAVLGRELGAAPCSTHTKYLFQQAAGKSRKQRDVLS